jgi:hypothetical protein
MGSDRKFRPKLASEGGRSKEYIHAGNFTSRSRMIFVMRL